MKETVVMLMFCLSVAITCGQQAPNSADFKKLHWLEGPWVRTNAKPGYSGEERWNKVSPIQLKGVGVTMKGADTMFVEKFMLVVKNNAIYYVADVPENKQPVDFKLTEISATGFTCENAAHDFPKMIRYEKEGHVIKATISGNGKSFEYLFKKK